MSATESNAPVRHVFACPRVAAAGALYPATGPVRRDIGAARKKPQKISEANCPPSA